MGLGKMAPILFKTEHHWKTEQKAIIWIPNAFGIPASTVVQFYLVDCKKLTATDLWAGCMCFDVSKNFEIVSATSPASRSVNIVSSLVRKMRLKIFTSCEQQL